jgi:hypothetical protein
MKLISSSDMVSAGNVDLFVSSPSLVSGTGDGSKKEGWSGNLEVELEQYESQRELNSYAHCGIQREVELRRCLRRPGVFFADLVSPSPG